MAIDRMGYWLYKKSIDVTAGKIKPIIIEISSTIYYNFLITALCAIIVRQFFRQKHHQPTKKYGVL